MNPKWVSAFWVPCFHLLGAEVCFKVFRWCITHCNELQIRHIVLHFAVQASQRCQLGGFLAINLAISFTMSKPEEVVNQVPEDEGSDIEAGGLFEDPPDFYPPSPPPTTEHYTMKNGDDITLHLVGHSPLEAHTLWNGAVIISQYFEEHPEEVKDRTVLEIGAAAGLPSLVAAVLGAKKVVVTDFPDPDIVDVMWKNIRGCPMLAVDREEDRNIVADGYVWGGKEAPLLAHLGEQKEGEAGFDVLILADLLFRHSEHSKLVDTIQFTLKKKPGSKAFVVFTSYRPWLQHKDLAFFDLARERGFIVDKFLEVKTEKPLFENDPGDEEIRKTVTGWTVRWPTDDEKAAAKADS